VARLGAWIALLLVAIYVILVGGAWDGIYDPSLRLATMVVTTGVLGVWAVIAWRSPEWRPRSTLWPAILAALGSLGVSTALSRDQRISLEYLGYAVVLAVLYLLLVRLMASPFFRARLAALGAMLFVALTILFIGQTVQLWLEWWAVLGHLTAPPLRPGFIRLTYGNPSAALTMVTLLAMPALATLARPGRWQGLITMLILAGVAVVALLSGSRAGWLALGGMVAAVVVARLASSSSRSSVLRVARSAVRRPRRGMLFIAACLAAIVLAVALGPTIIARVTSGGEASRLTFSAVALRIFVTAPLFGTGPGTWSIDHIAFTRPGETDEYVPYAHNLETQTLAELGILGALAGFVVVANVLWLLRNGLTDPDATRRRWASVAAIGLLYFVLHQLLDFYANLPAALIAAALPLAYLDATARSTPTVGQVSLRWPVGLTHAAGVLAAVALIGLTLQEVPAIQGQRAVDLANVGRWDEADIPARAAAAADPDLRSYDFSAGLTADRVGDHVAAAAFFERVVASDDFAEAWLDLAAERVALGRSDLAPDLIRRALRVGVQQPAVAFAAGELASRVGDRDTAVEALGVAVAGVPSLAADPWWSADPLRSGLLPLVMDRATTFANPDQRWELALMRGDADAAQLTAGTTEPTVFALVTSAWQGNDAARQALTTECDGDAQDLALLSWCARVLARDGDNSGRDHYLHIASFIAGAAFETGAEVRVVTSPLVGRELAGLPGFFWGLYTYRRATPWDLLVPGLAHLGLG